MNPGFGRFGDNYERLYITLPFETKKKLERISNQEHRSLSNMIMHLIETYSEQPYEEREYHKPPPKRSQRF